MLGLFEQPLVMVVPRPVHQFPLTSPGVPILTPPPQQQQQQSQQQSQHRHPRACLSAGVVAGAALQSLYGGDYRTVRLQRATAESPCCDLDMEVDARVAVPGASVDPELLEIMQMQDSAVPAEAFVLRLPEIGSTPSLPPERSANPLAGALDERSASHLCRSPLGRTSSLALSTDLETPPAIGLLSFSPAPRFM